MDTMVGYNGWIQWLLPCICHDVRILHMYMHLSQDRIAHLM